MRFVRCFLLALAAFAPAQTLELTPEERAWLAEHPTVRLAVTRHYPPVEFVDVYGRHAGITAEYAKLLSERLGIRFELVAPEHWARLIERVRAREADVVACMVKTRERSEYLLFTEPVIDLPVSFLSAQDLTVDQLSGRSVAVVRGYAVIPYLRETFPGLHLVEVATSLEAVRKASAGEVSAVVSDFAVASYIIEREGINNLRVVGETGYSYELAWGCRSDWPVLQGLLRKGLASISPAQRQAISRAWVHIDTGAGETLLAVLFGVVAVGFLVVVGTWRWNHALRRRVAEKTRELASHRDQLEEKVAARTAELTALNAALSAAKERAEALVQAKGRFLANVSHELRTPMSGVLSVAELLLTTELDDEQRRWVEVIDSSGQGLMGLLDDILDSAKIESGQVSLLSEDFSLASALTEVCGLFRATALDKGLAFELCLDQLAVERARGDAGRLRQILTNLLANALKFTAEGFVRVVANSSEEDGKVAVRITVEDSGIGIPLEARESIFGTFRQAANAGGKFGGSGLGLAISRELARMMDGDIGLSSAPGRGSCFSVRLRLAPAQGPARVEEAPRDVEWRAAGARVMLVEDAPNLQKVVRAMLESFGCTVTVAGDGLQALESWKQGDALELILMDFQLPGIDGLEATRRLRRAGCTVPIVALTASALDEEKERCREAGMDGFVAKPVLIRELRDTVQRHVHAEVG